MQKYLLPIFFGACAFVLFSGVMYAFHSTDYKAAIAGKLEQSDKMREEARGTACEYIGTLTSLCYKKKSEACAELESAEKDYVRAFSTNAYDTCFSQDDTVQSKEKTNPLFFGDAGGKQS